jgi:hypothetical protein
VYSRDPQKRASTNRQPLEAVNHHDALALRAVADHAINDGDEGVEALVGGLPGLGQLIDAFRKPVKADRQKDLRGEQLLVLLLWNWMGSSISSSRARSMRSMRLGPFSLGMAYVFPRSFIVALGIGVGRK